MLAFLIYLLPMVASVPIELILENYILNIDNGTLKSVRFIGNPNPVLNLSGMNLRSLEKNAFQNVPRVPRYIQQFVDHSAKTHLPEPDQTKELIGGK